MNDGRPWGFYFRQSWNGKQILRVLDPTGTRWVDATKEDVERVAFVELTAYAELNRRVALYERRAAAQRKAHETRKANASKEQT